MVVNSVVADTGTFIKPMHIAYMQHAPIAKKDSISPAGYRRVDS